MAVLLEVLVSTSRFSAASAPTTRRDRLGLRGVVASDDHRADDATLLKQATGGSAAVGQDAWGFVAALARLESTLLARGHGSTVSVWCAGAGGVAEPLTIGLLLEALDFRADVLATDLDVDAVNDDRPLPAWRIGRLPRVLRRRLRAVDGGFVADGGNGRLRSVQGDLRDGPAAGRFDLVVCRDVLHHYRPAVAAQMFAHLRAATADDGVLLLSAVDALAAGLPLGNDPVVLVDGGGTVRDPVAASLSPLLLHMSLLDDVVDDGRRADRFAMLADGCDLVEARVGAVVAALVDGDVTGARKQLALVPVDDPDHAVSTGLVELEAERFLEAKQALERAPSSSWLASWLLANLLTRQHRDLEARPLLLSALERLDNGGDTTTPVAAMMPELAPERVKQACRSALARSGWHRP